MKGDASGLRTWSQLIAECLTDQKLNAMRDSWLQVMKNGTTMNGPMWAQIEESVIAASEELKTYDEYIEWKRSNVH